jgi:hypothetical protein
MEDFGVIAVRFAHFEFCFVEIDPERSSSVWSQRFRKPTLSLVIQPVSNVLV